MSHPSAGAAHSPFPAHRTPHTAHRTPHTQVQQDVRLMRQQSRRSRGLTLQRIQRNLGDGDGVTEKSVNAAVEQVGGGVRSHGLPLAKPSARHRERRHRVCALGAVRVCSVHEHGTEHTRTTPSERTRWQSPLALVAPNACSSLRTHARLTTHPSLRRRLLSETCVRRSDSALLQNALTAGAARECETRAVEAAQAQQQH
jgi:hypothetical protein